MDLPARLCSACSQKVRSTQGEVTLPKAKGDRHPAVDYRHPHVSDPSTAKLLRAEYSFTTLLRGTQ